MLRRSMPWVLLFCLTVPVLPARAADEKAKPVLLARLKSIDGLLADGRYLAELAGKGEEAKQGVELLKAMIGGAKGLEGFDTTRPIGFYSGLTEGFVDSPVVLMLPVADEKAIMGLLERFEIKPEKNDDGSYSVTIPNVPKAIPQAHFRFANKYLYGTVGRVKNIAKDAILKPEDFFTDDENTATSLTINLDQIPDNLKKLALTQTERRVADYKDQKLPGETETIKAFRVAVIDETMSEFKTLLDDGKTFTLRAVIDKKAGELALTTSLIGKPGSDLAKAIAETGSGKSVAAGIIATDAAVRLLTHVSLPGNLRKTLEPAVDEVIGIALKKENDNLKKELLEIVLKAVAPTVKSAELDAGFSMTGPNGNGLYSMVFGVKVKDGSDIEKAVKQVLEKAPPEAKDIVKVDVEKVGGVNIHKITPPQIDEKTRKMLGDNPIYFAVRDNALIVSAGDKGLATLKSALSAEPKAGTCFQLDIALAKLAPVMDDKVAAAAAKQAFEKGKNDDQISVTFRGGKSAEFRLSAKAQLVKFFVLADELKKKEQ